jgi:hypothetical protein
LSGKSKRSEERKSNFERWGENMEQLKDYTHPAHLYEESKDKNGNPTEDIIESNGSGSPNKQYRLQAKPNCGEGTFTNQFQ